MHMNLYIALVYMVVAEHIIFGNWKTIIPSIVLHI